MNTLGNWSLDFVKSNCTLHSFYVNSKVLQIANVGFGPKRANQKGVQLAYGAYSFSYHHYLRIMCILVFYTETENLDFWYDWNFAIGFKRGIIVIFK